MTRCKVCGKDVNNVPTHAVITHDREKIVESYTEEERKELFSFGVRERTVDAEDLKDDQFGYDNGY